MEVLAALVEQPENITFATLFIGLLVWVIRSNTDRENKYLDTIKTLTEALKSLELIQRTVTEIKNRMDQMDHDNQK